VKTDDSAALLNASTRMQARQTNETEQRQRATYFGLSLSSISGGKNLLATKCAMAEIKNPNIGARINKRIFFQKKTENIVRTIATRKVTCRILLVYSGETTNVFPQKGQSKGSIRLMRTYGKPLPQSGHNGKRELMTDLSTTAILR
jgi:hypothetical protein